MSGRSFAIFAVFFILCNTLDAGVGDPQIRTDHPWYPGELACSTFARLFATQAAVYERVTGVKPATDEQKALAAWLWRNTHYYHGEEGSADLWGQGFTRGMDQRNREYWTGLFAHGFGLCGTTHSQWTAEIEALLGHNRGRDVGVSGHNSFEVFLTGGPYGKGKWALLDHDISTVIFNPAGTALLSLKEVQRDWRRLTDRRFLPDRQQGWLVCGLHPDDGGVYRSYQVAEYLSGYSAAPPMVHLRRGETLRRYLRPGLADGQTFVFWGHNYRSGGIAGPERAHSWVNQPEKMHGSRDGTGFRPGQARYGNAVYVYKPDFTSRAYQEGVVAEDDQQVTLAFHTPYVIGATPPNNQPWGIYDSGCRNGLVVRGQAKCRVSVSADRGRSWHDAGPMTDGLDLTDQVKGRQQYFLRFHAGTKALRQAGLTITTVCQANAAILPRLQDQDNEVRFQSSGQAVVSAGPTLPQAQAHVVEGKFGSPTVTLELATPRGEEAMAIHAAAHVQSGSPPRPDVKYHIDLSTDGGKTWTPLVKDWTITRRGEEPKDFWSQSFCWGAKELAGQKVSTVRVRFHNTGRRPYARGEVQLVYRLPQQDDTKVTFAWSDDRGSHQATHTFTPGDQEGPRSWKIPTGRKVETQWVEFTPVVGSK